MKEKEVFLFNILSFSFQPVRGDWVATERRARK
jgi:hypothetical protein